MQTPQHKGAVQRPPVTIVRLKGKPYVTGLFWQSLTNARAPLQEARKTGKRDGTAYAAIRRGTILQAGYVEAGRGAQVGMVSLAAALASRLGKNWIAVVELGVDKYFLCVVNEGAIHPQTDFVGSKEEVHERFARIQCQFNWDRDKIFLPKGFTNVAVGDELDLEKVLGQTDARECKLQSLSFSLTRRQIWILAAIALLAIGGIGGHAYWTSVQRAKAAAEAQRIAAERERELAALNAATKKLQTEQALDHPWAKRPALQTMLAACAGTVNGLPAYLAGWGFESAKCDETSVVATFRRAPNASVADIKRVAKLRYNIEPAITADYEQATLTLPVQVAPGGDDNLLDVATRVDSFMSFFQRSLLSVKLTEAPPPPPPAAPLPGNGTQAPPPPPPPPWARYTWQLDTEQVPTAALAAIDSTGLRLTSLTLQMRNDATTATPLLWILTGDLYAKK